MSGPRPYTLTIQVSGTSWGYADDAGQPAADLEEIGRVLAGHLRDRVMADTKGWDAIVRGGITFTIDKVEFPEGTEEEDAHPD